MSEQRIEYLRVKWNVRLKDLMDELKPTVGTDAIRKAVENEQIGAFEVVVISPEGEKVFVGYFLTRVDVLWNGEQEMVVLHAVTEMKGKAPVEFCLASIFPAIAREKKIKTVRVHSQRKGLDVVMEKIGYQLEETVWRFEVKDDA